MSRPIPTTLLRIVAILAIVGLAAAAVLLGRSRDETIPYTVVQISESTGTSKSIQATVVRSRGHMIELLRSNSVTTSVPEINFQRQSLVVIEGIRFGPAPNISHYELRPNDGRLQVKLVGGKREVAAGTKVQQTFAEYVSILAVDRERVKEFEEAARVLVSEN